MNEIIATENSIMNQTIDASLMDDFIEYIDAKPKTVQTYTRAIKQFYKYMMENGITQPTEQTVKDYKKHLIETNHKPTTIQNYIVALKQFFKWTEKNGFYKNIVHVKGAKISKSHKKDYLTSKQIGTILKAIDTSSEKGLRDFAMIALMATGGLRTIEVANARIEDLRTLGNDTVLYLLGKGRDERTEYIKVTSEVETAIRMYLKSREDSKDKSQPLFASTSRNNKGKGITTRTVSSIVKTRMQAVGLDDERLTAHSLRHSAVTIALLNGVDLQEVQQFARHSNIQTTLIYSHAIERSKSKCESTIAHSIFG